MNETPMQRRKWFNKEETQDKLQGQKGKGDPNQPPQGWKAKLHPKNWWKVIQVNMQPRRPIKGQPTFYQSLRAVIFASWLNVLMIFIPISWVCHFHLKGDTATTPSFSSLPLLLPSYPSPS